MANIWDEFDKAIDTEGLAKDVEEAAAHGADAGVHGAALRPDQIGHHHV
mgnify:FL=1